MNTLLKTVTPIIVLAILFRGDLAQASNTNDTKDSKLRTAPLTTGKSAPDEGTYLGRTLTYWLKCIETRDPQSLEIALDAVAEFGPDAAQAVPALTRIVGEPFVPINAEMDSAAVVKAKLHNIVIRAAAIDALAAIGPAAAPSADALVQWALAKKVLPPMRDNPAKQDVFVDLVSIDVFERMRVAGAVAQFGTGAAPVISGLLRSGDGERRKLAVAILNEEALFIATDLLKSSNCDDQIRGLAILTDMWPIVAREHLADLKSMIVCEAN